MTPILERAKARLLEAVLRANAGAPFNAAGYASTLEGNLVFGVSRDLFEADYRAGAGHELDWKMRAAYSSAALVVNTFAPWKKAPSTLFLANLTGFNSLRFEAVFQTGLGGTPHTSTCLPLAPRPSPWSPNASNISPGKPRCFRHPMTQSQISGAILPGFD